MDRNIRSWHENTQHSLTTIVRTYMEIIVLTKARIDQCLVKEFSYYFFYFYHILFYLIFVAKIGKKQTAIQPQIQTSQYGYLYSFFYTGFTNILIIGIGHHLEYGHEENFQIKPKAHVLRIPHI